MIAQAQRRFGARSQALVITFVWTRPPGVKIAGQSLAGNDARRLE
jgi:hypothetical protein